MQYTIVVPDASLSDVRKEFRRRLGDQFPLVKVGEKTWVDDPAVDPVQLYLDDFIEDETLAADRTAARVALDTATSDAEKKDALLSQHDLAETKTTLQSNRKVRGEKN